MLQAGTKAQAAVQVTVAQAGLLLDLTRAGLSAGAESSELPLTLLVVLSKLRSCQVPLLSRPD